MIFDVPFKYVWAEDEESAVALFYIDTTCLQLLIIFGWDSSVQIVSVKD